MSILMNVQRKSNFQSPGVIRHGFLLAALLLVCVACGGQPAAADPTPQVFNTPASQISAFTPLTLLSKDDPTHAHWVGHFGWSVDIDQDVLAAGEPYWGRPPGEAAGAAYVFRRSPEGEWRLEASLAASDRDDGFQYDQHFGGSIAVKGTVVAVGAPGYDDPQAGDNIGAVYIFEYDGRTWFETGKLVSSLPASGAQIGSAIAFDGEYLAASGSPEASRVSIFQRQAGGWRETAVVPVPPLPEGKPYVLLDLYGDTLAVSTVTMPPTPTDQSDEKAFIQSLKTKGIVTIYERTGDQWKQTFQTTPQEASLYGMTGEASFGIPVSIGGDAGKASWLAVGKPGFPGSGHEKGSVAIYERRDRGWKAQAELMLAPGEPAPGALSIIFPRPTPGAPAPDVGPAYFGAFVNFEGSRLAVVSTFANAAYVFERQGPDWVYRLRISPGPEYGDDFQRRTTAMSGSSLVLGSPGDLGGGYIFVFNLPP